MNWTRIDTVALAIFLYTTGYINDSKYIDYYIEDWDNRDTNDEFIIGIYKTANKLCSKIRKYESDNMNNPSTVNFKEEDE